MKSLLASCLLLFIAHAGKAQGVLPLPSPTGAQRVGTSVSYLMDASRRRPELPTGRPITLQLWYPTMRAATTHAPYLFEKGLDSVLLRQQYFGADSSLAQVWGTVETHSSLDAPVAPGKHPLVTFSVGFGTIRASYTSLAEDLASHGYIVALVESPLQGMMLTTDGRVISDTTNLYGTPQAHSRGVEEWKRDMSWTLTKIAKAVNGQLGKIAQATDWSRVGAMGHSTGGIVALAACESDARIRACINLDGGVAGPGGEPMAEFVPRGLAKPTLILRSQPLYDDSTFVRRKITRAEWEKRGEQGRLAFDSLRVHSRIAPKHVGIAGTGHSSFSDAPFVMPTAISRFGGRIIAPQRGFEIITAVVRAFFDSVFSTRPQAFDSVLQAYPELTRR